MTGTIDLITLASGARRAIPGGYGVDLSWSPDGSYLAYVPFPSGPGTEIKLVPVAGGPVTVAIGDITYFTLDVTPLPAPATVTATLGNGQVTLRWTSGRSRSAAGSSDTRSRS